MDCKSAAAKTAVAATVPTPLKTQVVSFSWACMIFLFVASGSAVCYDDDCICLYI